MPAGRSVLAAVAAMKLDRPKAAADLKSGMAATSADGDSDLSLRADWKYPVVLREFDDFPKSGTNTDIVPVESDR